MSGKPTGCGLQADRESDYGDQLVRSISKLRHEEQLCDVVISSEGKTFPAHKLILAASSSFFQSLFTMDMRERHEQEVQLNNIEARVLARVLDYIYTGKLTTASAYEARQMYLAADYLILPGLKEMASRALEKCLSVDNCLQMLAWAHRFSNRALLAQAFRFVLDNFNQVSRTRDFLKLPPQELHLILASNNLRIVDEEEVYEALRRWTEQEAEKRREFYAEFIDLIRLEHISRFYIEHVICEDMLRLGNERLRRKISEMLNEFQNSENSQCIAIDPLQPPRRYVAMVITVLVPDVYSYIPTTREWFEMAPVPTPRVASSSVACCGMVYTVGGLGESGDSTNIVECLDPSANAWSTKASLPVPTRAAGVASLGDFLFVVGGRSNSARFNIVQRYNPRKDSWTLVTSLHEPRSGAALVSSHGNLYAIGGRRDETTFHRSVECYSPELNTWTLTSPMSVARASCAAANIRDMIYVTGGVRSPGVSHNSCEVYDVVLDQWSIISDTVVPRSYAGIAPFKECLLLCGGEDSGDFQDTVEYYDIETDSWQVADKMPQPEKFVDCCAMFMPKDLLPIFPAVKCD